MKKSIYIIFMIFVMGAALLEAHSMIKDYNSQKIVKMEADNISIFNSNGSYLILYNPTSVKVQEGKDQETADQNSILVTVPFDLEGARYFILDDYYTKLDYRTTTLDGKNVTEVNLYNAKRQEKVTYDYNTTGQPLSNETQKEKLHVDMDEIPKGTTTSSINPTNNKVSLSKGTSYVEIPEYFKVEENNYTYTPVDFIQFTNLLEE